MKNTKFLTVDMIPEGYNYAAVDSDGAAYAYVKFPSLSSNGWVCSSTDCKYVLIGKYFNNDNWIISLITREHLPKITQKTLTVDDIPHGYFWAAVEPDGVAYAFGDMPNLSVDYNSWQAEESNYYKAIGENYDASNWKRSLITSHKNCKVFFENPTVDDIPEGYNYIAVSSYGRIYAFIQKPLMKGDYWEKVGDESYNIIGVHVGEFDWKNSLVFRVSDTKFKTLTEVDIPEGFNYAAVDSCGTAFAYRSKPVPHSTGSYWASDVEDSIEIEGYFDASDWKNSLVSKNEEAKPKKLTAEDIPVGFNFAAVDYDGLAYAYESKPWLDENEECWKAHDCWQMSSMFYLGSDYDIVDFKNSLVLKNKSVLKELTVDDIPNGYSYAAVNSDGFAFAYKEAPVLLDGYHDVPNKIYSGWGEYCKLIGYGYDVSNWENSLVSRTPEKVDKFSSFDNTFLEVAEVIAKRSKSTRLKVGAVLVKDNRIIATGYNGLVSGVKPDVLEDENGVSKKEVIHAELNCIISCARNGVSCEGSTLYITHSPCESCAALIAQSGIKKVIFKEYYRDLSGVEKLKSYGVEIV